MVASVDAVVGKDAVSFEGADQDGISVFERKTLLLTERYRQVLLGIGQLEQVLAEVKPGFVSLGQCDHATILGVVSEELVSSKRNEADFMHKLNTFGEENKALIEELENVKAARDAADAEAGTARAEFEQMEHKFLTTKEKLSMAVTKGKSLVQHRDSLKQMLAEKTGELERCTVELQQKSDAFQAAEGRIEELQSLLDEKSAEQEKCLDELRETYSAWEAAKASIEQLNEENTALTSVQASLSRNDGVLQRIEEVMSEATFPEDLLSLEVTDRLEWLVEQKKIADMIFWEHRKVKDILGSVDFPHSVLTGELDSQITWLADSLSQAKDDAVRMQNESSEILQRLSAHESKLVSMHEEIDRLTIVLLEEKQEKDILVNEHSELMSLYNAAVDKLSVISSQNTELVKAFAEVSDVKLSDSEPLESAKLIDQCLSNIQQRERSSPIECESLEKLQTLVYTLDQELALSKIILEEDATDRSERMRLSGELQKMEEAIFVLKNEKDSLQKEFERVEEKSSLLREKLSMAVKKGKGLVQEREGLKQVVDAKNSEIEKLKNAFDEKVSETESAKHALSRNNSEIEKLQHALSENNSELEKLKQALDENTTETENLKQALDEKNSESDKLKRDLEARNTEMENLKHDIVSRESANTDLREQVENLSSQVAHFDRIQLDIISLSEEKGNVERMLEEAKVSWGILVDSISNIALPVDYPFEEPVEKISQIAQYIMELQAAKNHVEHELDRANEQVTMQAGRLSDSLSTIKILEDELSKAKDYISCTSEERHQIQLQTAAVEKELEKTNEELAHNANKLELANTTINSLQDALSQARTDLAIVSSEKSETEANHEMETSALNAKLAKCLEELDKSHGSLQTHSTEQYGYLEKLSKLVMDDSTLPLMAEEFGKNMGSLRDMSLTVKSMHEQLAAMGLQIDPIMEVKCCYEYIIFIEDIYI
jgi:chromosome segregation ATPase